MASYRQSRGSIFGKRLSLAQAVRIQKSREKFGWIQGVLVGISHEFYRNFLWLFVWKHQCILGSMCSEYSWCHALSSFKLGGWPGWNSARGHNCFAR